jgi:hypothetical protein
MRPLLEKLNYKGQQRIAVLNAEKNFKMAPMKEIKDIRIDTEIDPRYPYDFMILFVRKAADVKEIVPVALHNLAVDGVLWFCYPKKPTIKYSSDLDRDHGWKTLNDLGFFGIRIVSINEEWSALRFRNIKYIKAVSERFAVKK